MVASVEQSLPSAFIAREGSIEAPLFLTCEHGSERFPEPWTLPVEDRWLLGTHWAYDLGAAELTLELADALGCSAVIADFSRLLVDPNREPTSPTLFRDEAEGAPIHLNAALTADERERRITALYTPYHRAIDHGLARTSAPVLFSVHSFTPVYDGFARPMEIGVLFNREERLAEALASAFAAEGFVVAMNEPYSGREGLIHSAEHHADAFGRRALEIEVRQDLAVVPAVRARVIAAVRAFAARLGALL